MSFFKCIFKDLLTNLNVRYCFFFTQKGGILSPSTCEIEWSEAGTTTPDRESEWFTIICQNLKDVCIVLFYRRESIYRWNGITFGLVLNIYKQTTSRECLQLEQINNK